MTDCTPAWPCANDTDILIHPYVFRVVCGNGAIMAQAVQTRHIVRDSASPFSIEAEVRQAIRCCCEPEAFTFAADQMRTAKQSQADMLINMSAFLELTAFQGRSRAGFFANTLRWRNDPPTAS